MKIKILPIVLFCLISTIIILTGFFFLTSEGVIILHKHTNIPCKALYDKETDTWKLAYNTTNNTDFIKECKARGIGIK